MSKAQEAKIHLDNDELQTVLIAMAKQVPMMIKNTFVWGRYGQCPTCSKLVGCDEKYCSECGQKLMFKVDPLPKDHFKNKGDNPWQE